MFPSSAASGQGQYNFNYAPAPSNQLQQQYAAQAYAWQQQQQNASHGFPPPVTFDSAAYQAQLASNSNAVYSYSQYNVPYSQPYEQVNGAPRPPIQPISLTAAPPRPPTLPSAPPYGGHPYGAGQQQGSVPMQPYTGVQPSWYPSQPHGGHALPMPPPFPPPLPTGPLRPSPPGQGSMPSVGGYAHKEQRPQPYAAAPIAAPPPRPALPSAAPPAPAPAPAPSSQWPPALEAWAGAQLAAMTGLDAVNSEKAKKEVFALVNTAAKNGTLWSRDWSSEPSVPTVRALQEMKRKQETAAALAAAAQALAQNAASSQSAHQASSGSNGGWGDSAYISLSSSASRGAQRGEKGGYGSGGRAEAWGGQGGLRRDGGWGVDRSSTPTSDAQGPSGFLPSGSNAMPLGKSMSGKRPRPGLEGEGWEAGSTSTERADTITSSPGGRKQKVAKEPKPKPGIRRAGNQTWRAGDDTPLPAASSSTPTYGSGGGGGGWAGIFAGGSGLAGNTDEDIDWSKIPAIQGTCQVVEKRYLRLIAPPDPAEVRPLPVLEQALAHVKHRYESGQEKYRMYTWEQLKSIRQDLAVQHILTPFTCAVYETHARYALENQDPEEYNKCQHQLIPLYEELGASSEGGKATIGCYYEFLAYRCLYLAYTAQGDSHDARQLLMDMSEEERAHPWVAHAVRVRAAVACENWGRFFKLYRLTPTIPPSDGSPSRLTHGQHILSLVLHKRRTECTMALVAAMGPVKPGIPLSWLQGVLAFDVAGSGGQLSSCAEWCAGVGCVLADKEGVLYIDPKASKVVHTREQTMEEREFAQAGLKLLAPAQLLADAMAGSGME